MSWFLKIQDGERFRDLAVLLESQPIVVGRAHDVDVCIPDDIQISGRHVRIYNKDGQVTFEDLRSTNGTFLNGEPAATGVLEPGSLLRCGNTILTVETGSANSPAKSTAVGASATPAAHAHAGQSKTSEAVPIPPEVLEFDGFCSETAPSILEQFQLSKIVKMPAEPDETAEDFAFRALDSEDVNDSLNFLAFALKKRLAVWWAINCIRAEQAFVSEHDEPLLDLATQWVQNPSETLRRNAMKMAEKAEMSTAAAWVGVAIFWTHGSMAPPEAPAVPPAPDLSGKAIAGAVILASVAR
ncbi:MAG: FHA domain-containing protein, partial [Planctomycetaceae bacterium]|nr:FHA domain-containing protein [Planctomycetaceae bacterium]